MTNYPNSQGNPAGAMPTYMTPSPINTYRVQVVDVVPAATATDVLTIAGSATKTVTVNRIQITASASGAGAIDIYAFRRAAVDTGGTSTSPTICRNNSTNPAATAAVKLYSANPTINDSGVLVAADHYGLASKSGVDCIPVTVWVEDFGNRGDQGLVLNGTAEQLCVGFNGQTIPAGMDVYIMVEWTES